MKSNGILHIRAWVIELTKNTGLMMLAQGARSLEAVIRSVIIARALSGEDYATFATVLAFITMVMELTNFNIGAAIITYGARYRVEGKILHLRALLKCGYFLSAIMAIIGILVIAGLLGFSYSIFIHHPGLYWQIIALAAAVALYMFHVINKPVMRLLDRFNVICVGDFIVVFVNTVFLFGYFSLTEVTISNAFFAFALCMVFSGLVDSILAISISMQVVGNWLIASVLPLRKDAIAIGRMMIGNSLSSTMQKGLNRLDVLLLAAFSTPNNVAIYDIAKKLIAMTNLLRMALALAAWPQISTDLAKRRVKHLRILLSRFVMFGLVAIVPIWICAFFLVKPILASLFGEKYIPSAPIFLVLLVAALISILFFWANALLLSGRRVRTQMLASALGLVLLVVFGIPLAAIYGAIGMAWAVVLATIGMYSLIAWYTRRILRSITSMEGKDYCTTQVSKTSIEGG